MTQGTVSIVEEVDRIIEEHAMLKHPFYQAWQRGELTLDALRGYAGQYYHHVLAFPQYVSGAHASCPDQKDRQELLENLIEEERGDENHPELWLRFSDALEMSRDSVEKAELLPRTIKLVDTFRDATKNGSFAEAATALYCYESQIPEVAKTKIAGLKEFYNVSSPSGLKFFEVHIEADEWHAEVGRKFVERYGNDPSERAGVLETAQRCVDALWTFLDGVYEAEVVSEAAG